MDFQRRYIDLRVLGDENDLVSSKVIFKACLFRGLKCMAWLTWNGLKNVKIW